MDTHSMRNDGLGTARLATLLALTALPVVLTSTVMPVLRATGVPSSHSLVGSPYWAFTVYAVANWLTFALVVRVAGWAHLRAHGFRFQLDRARVAAALLGFMAGVGIYLGVSWALRQFALPGVGGMSFRPSGGPQLLVLAMTTVLTAAFCEEVFFRVVWIGGLATRASGWIAGLVSILAFSAIHYPYFGVGGVIFITCWATVPVALFMVFGDFSAALLMHVLNNAWAYLVVPLLFASAA